MAENPNDEERIRKAREKLDSGIDLLDWRLDYTKTLEENHEIYRQKFYETYGAYPEEI